VIDENHPFRAAVIGAGPAGMYVAAALTTADGWAGRDVQVDIFDRLPTPFGLLRYGVAPDHLKMKTLTTTLQRVLDHAQVRFFGNVNCGVDVSVADLRRHYHAVIYCFGAAADRKLGIPGEDLTGSFSAGELVNWYSSHPDQEDPPVPLDVTTAVVVGAGNVAIDVARILVRHPSELRVTDMPESALNILDKSSITDVHLVARKGPAEAKYTSKELRELGELEGVDVIVDPADLELDAREQELAEGKITRRNLATLRDWAARTPQGAPRRLHLHFRQKPVEIRGGERVESVVLASTDLARAGQTGELATGLVVRAIGYRGIPLPDVPFDHDAGVIPTSADGRVQRDGGPAAGEYAAGWIKRGPQGVVGTNRSDADQTTATIVADAADLDDGPRPDFADELAARGITPVDCAGWLLIDSAEVTLGAQAGRARSKLATRTALLAARLP
jgi:ferredoxin--NADP+ reductase